jgi:phosphatidate cytidylyltransferase
MKLFIYYILFFLCLGGMGMAIANRRVDKKTRQQRWLKYFTYIGITGAVVISIIYGVFYWMAWVLVAAMLIELARANSKDGISMRLTMSSSVIFLLFLYGFLLFAETFKPAFLLFVYFQVLVFDGFSQVTGQLFGRRLLAPIISPGKTVEGLAGGLLFCIVAALLGTSWLQPRQPALLFSMGSGVFTAFFSLGGDKMASYYKRTAGIKDYSNWLPGQGGFLDRFDSFLLTGAAYYLISRIIFKSIFHEFNI